MEYSSKNLIIKDLINHPTDRFFFWASRPQTIQRDEIAYLFLEKYQKKFKPTLVTIPLEGNNRALYVEKKSW